MRTKLIFFLTALLVSALSLSGYGQEFPFLHFPDKNNSFAEVLAIQQNQNKEIQFVTPEGVFSFNGRQTSKIFSFPAAQPSGISQALFTAEKLLVLSDGKLLAIDPENEKAENINTGAGITEKIFYHSGEDKVYLLAGGQLKLLKEKGETETVLEGVKNVQAAFFGENEIILAGNHRLSVYGLNGVLQQNFTTAEPITDSYFTNERLLLLTPKFIYSRETAGALKKYQHIVQENPLCILEDQTGKVWVGTQNNGLILYDGNQIKPLGLHNNFPLQEVQGIYQSFDLSVWFYGRGGLVLRPFSAPFLKFQAGKHFAGKEIQDISAAAGSGDLAVLTRDAYFHKIMNETVQETSGFSIPFVPHYSKILGEEESVHLSRAGELFYRKKGKTFRHSFKKEITRLFSFTNRSLIWSREGDVYSFSHGSRKIAPLKPEIPVEGAVFQQGESLIFSGSKGRIIRWDSQTGNQEVLADSVSGISHLTLFSKKYLIFLHTNGSLKYLSEGRLTETAFSLKANEEVKGFVGSDSNLWISTEDHLYQISLGLESDGSLHLQTAGVFKAEDYALELPIVKSTENEEGSFWLASENELYLYNSLSLAPDVSPPGFVLERVLIQKKDSLSLLDPVKKDSVKVNLQEEEHLLIYVFSVNYDQKNKASVKYRFPDNDSGWKEPLPGGPILISGLKPGRHAVELLSENEQGVRSKQRSVFLIEVSKAPWNKWFLAAGASLSLVLAGFVAYIGLRSGREGKGREAGEKYERELQRLRKRSHEQMVKADGLKQVNELISAQKEELEGKNKQIIAQKYELSLTNNQITQQKNLIEKTTEKLQSSINYAQEIQTALMGDEILIKEDLPESFVFFKARDQVSGDFFWFEKIKNDKGEKLLIIAAVDCTGHGVPGAIVSVVGIQLLSAIVNAKKMVDPGQILTELNTDLLRSLRYEQTKINDGMDMSLCTINLAQKKLYFAGAKNPVYYFEDGELHIIKGDKMPIGGQKFKAETPFQTHEIQLKGDGRQMFYLFSDGYQDQFGGPGQFKFMVKNFKELLKDMSSKSMMEQKYILGKTLSEWQGNEEQTDDILVLGFRI